MTPTGRFRSTLRVLACWATAGALATGVAAPAVAAEPPPGKIEPGLRHQLDAAGGTDFWVRFRARADLASASEINDWAERGSYVADALQRTAAASQAGVRAQLDRVGVSYRPFWATNAIYVRNGSSDLAAQLAVRAEVESLRATTAYAVPTPVKGQDVQTVDAVEWGIANINADDAWAQYGVTGADITVANIDTGVQYDHPALVRQYRGNRGDGTFDHDYNWFDAAGTCAAAPCDTNGHGTHTMGTMAGDDGGDNRVGVAPGVTWIAANGCCPSDEALVASGEWMLQPRDLSGRNPDASRRPHVINNSWGTLAPSNDPFMEDVSLAWAASGIFAMWSNGNNAPGCQTSGSPGSRIVNYSAGAYDASNAIAGFSSRGAGQDGETKPNISAPGVNVRSAWPRSAYASINGTSMAAPHVAGAVALLWSAAPALVGDVAATRELLDGSAVDSPDGECGGTDEDNNVFGEGRLDALALLDAAPVGETGTLRVTVSSSGRPIAGARVTVTGPADRERFTGADGTLSLPLPAGDYSVTVSAFGHADQTASVTIETGETSALNVRLHALRTVQVEGRVTDGSGQGWPLYAKITVDGVPNGTYYTRPADGGYRFTLPADRSYTVHVEPRYGGYRTVTEQLVVGRRDVRHDVRVPVDAQACTAAGYRVGYAGAGTDFGPGLPAGWTVTDEAGTGQVWRLDNPGRRANLTGGAGGFAIMDSRFYGFTGRQDTSLVTPPVDLSGQSAPVIGFRQDYDDRFDDVATVELSVDGGATWETLLRQVDPRRGPREESIAIPQAANRPDVRVRFRFVGANADWWQLDDVYVGARLCEPVPGGLLVGHVHDRNTGKVLNGATVTGGADPAVSTRSAATPDDPALADGFYWMFVPGPGDHELTATLDGHGYAAHAQRVAMAAGRVTERDFRLPAGRLSVKPDDVSVSLEPGRTAHRKITVTNTGSAPARLELAEGREPVDYRGTDGGGAPVVRVEGDFSPLALATSRDPAAAPAAPPGGGPDSPPWLQLPDHPTRIMDNAVDELDGRIYSVGGVDGTDITARAHVYDPRERSWARIADLPQGRENAAGAFIGGVLYVSGGWGPDVRAVRTTFAYDPASNTWRTVADAPVAAAAAARAVLDGRLYLVGGCTNACDGTEVRRYDPATDRWEMLAAYPQSAGHLACGAIDGRLYCTGGVRRGGITWRSTYAYDPASNTWTARADMPIPLWGMGYTVAYGQLLVSGGITNGSLTNEGFAYDPRTDSWSRLPAANRATYRGGSACGFARVGGSVSSGFNPTPATELLPSYGSCAPLDVPWLSFDAGGVTLAPGARVTVTVRLSAEQAPSGVHTAGVWIREDTPYLVFPVKITMTVRPRLWDAAMTAF